MKPLKIYFTVKEHRKLDNKAVLEFAVTTGERMLANGCGTHRIEGLINKILKNCEFKNHEIFVTTTGIVVTVRPKQTGLPQW